jgi:hypothetical protein
MGGLAKDVIAKSSETIMHKKPEMLSCGLKGLKKDKTNSKN